MKSIGIIGSGQMGAGIAQVAAQAEFSVFLYDVADAALQKGLRTIETSLAKLAQKGKITEEQKKQTLSRLQATSKMDDFKKCDLVIEAVPEKLSLKQEIFQKLDSIVKKEAILATNTSSISITQVAAATQRPDKVLGLHFMNPVPLMPLVEVIRGNATSDTTYTGGLAFIQRLGKTPITAKDHPGFVINRILCPMLNEAAYALHEGLATKEDIDLGMKLGCNFPMGPLTLADFVGLDTLVAILEIMKKTPCPLLKKMVAEGKLGRKNGEGFYKY